ncbi:hypothetical protein JXB02_04475 [Candidatus Woesearchaeota archaeon]|nr:hypothetical protein [Candidatus Woesearchaeota archaeon]
MGEGPVVRHRYDILPSEYDEMVSFIRILGHILDRVEGLTLSMLLAHSHTKI